MIEKGSLVKLVNMEHEYNTGFNKSWQNGMVGTVTKYIKTTNISNGKTSELCNIKLLIPYLSNKGNPVKWLNSIDVRNLEEIERIPIYRDKGGK